jgi:hypothetical protein
VWIGGGVAYVVSNPESTLYALAAGGCGQATCSPLRSVRLGDQWGDMTAPGIADGTVVAVASCGASDLVV